jgi:mannose-1-phosphate guanylyltransferase
MGRNTAPAIGLAATHLMALNPDTIMVVLPADHRITNTKLFHETLETAIKLVEREKSALVTLGLTPSYPSTGYGYIEAGESLQKNTFKVTRFTEKPEKEMANDFIRQGNYYWNSGMFVWRADTILAEIKRHMPEWYAGFLDIKAAFQSGDSESVCDKVYASLDGQSIDYGIMEKADNVYMVQADFGWSDLGTWEEVYNSSRKDANGNVIKGQPLLFDVTNSYVEIDGRTVSIIGVDNVIIVDQPDALLVCRKDLAQDVRWVTKKLDEAKKKNAS